MSGSDKYASRARLESVSLISITWPHCQEMRWNSWLRIWNHRTLLIILYLSIRFSKSFFSYRIRFHLQNTLRWWASKFLQFSAHSRSFGKNFYSLFSAQSLRTLWFIISRIFNRIQRACFSPYVFRNFINFLCGIFRLLSRRDRQPLEFFVLYLKSSRNESYLF